MNPKLIWESLDSNIDRTPIPGGWLVRYYSWLAPGPQLSPGGMVFLADPEHTWNGCSITTPSSVAPAVFNVAAGVPS